MRITRHLKKNGTTALKKKGKFVGTIPASTNPPTINLVPKTNIVHSTPVELKIKLPSKPLIPEVSANGFVTTEISVGRRFPETDEQVLYLKLLDIGGDKVVTPAHREDEITQLFERGSFSAEGARVKLLKGRDSSCHANSAILWEAKKGDIVTGYALSDDGLWRQHTWIVSKRNRIIETTVHRLRYYGYKLTDEEAEDFAWENNY